MSQFPLTIAVLAVSTSLVGHLVPRAAAQNEESSSSMRDNSTIYTPAPTLVRGEEKAEGLATNTTVVLIVLPCCLIALVSILIIKFCSGVDVKPIDGTNHRQRNAEARRELQRERWDPVDAATGNVTTEADALNANQKWSVAKLKHLTTTRAFRFVSFLGLSGSGTTAAEVSTADNQQIEQQQQQQSNEDQRIVDHHDVALAPRRMSNNFVDTTTDENVPTTNLVEISINPASDGDDVNSPNRPEDERTPLVVASDSRGLFRDATRGTTVELTTVRAFSPTGSSSFNNNSMSSSLRKRQNIQEQLSPLVPNPFTKPRSKKGREGSSSSSFPTSPTTMNKRAVNPAIGSNEVAKLSPKDTPSPSLSLSHEYL